MMSFLASFCLSLLDDVLLERGDSRYGGWLDSSLAGELSKEVTVYVRSDHCNDSKQTKKK